MPEIARLLSIMAQLRHPETGCPWDIKQTFATVAPSTIEEAYEVVDAIERNDLDELREELGDLLFQVVFHARIAEEAGAFTFSDVARAINEKMLRRHPHVFGDRKDLTAEELRAQWESHKEQERANKAASGSSSALDGVALNLPALIRAEKIQNRAKRVGFDWDTLAPVIAKVQEELAEVQQASTDQDQQHTEEEVGDLLFAVVNLSRHLSVDPEKALRSATAKFSARFLQVERLAQSRGMNMQSASLDELDMLWEEVKESNAQPAHQT